MAQPSQDAISQFMDFTACNDEKLVIQFLQGSNCDVMTAVNQYYENPDPSRFNQVQSTYDESAFSQDRYGESSSNHPSFQIHHGNGNAYSDFPNSTAPTRPNSRISNTSTKALADYQENGVVGGNSHFGPATRTEYDPAQWGMTAVESTTEFYPDLDLPDLTRQNGEPVIIKPRSDQNRLPALLSILGNISLVRKTILESPPSLDDYGFNADWWSGTSIQTSGNILSVEDPSKSNAIEFLAETQRLFAFMDWSQRLYGSSEPLENSRLMQHGQFAEGYGAASPVEAFLKTWISAMSSQVCNHGRIYGLSSY